MKRWYTRVLAAPLARRILWALLALAPVLVYFAPASLQGYLLAPGDGLAQNFPARILVADALKRGELPFWNPFIFGGMPLLASIQPAVFYPGNWTFLALPPVAAMAATVLLAFWAAAAGAFAYGRALGMRAAGALVTATIYALGGFLAYHVEAINMVQAAAGMPWLLWAIERFDRTDRLRYPLIGAAIVALTIVAGHPQMTAYSLLVAGLYALFRTWRRPAAKRLGLLAPLALGVALGLGMSSAQLWPTLDFIATTQRQHIPYEVLVRGSLSPEALPGFWLPFLFGTRAVDGWLKVPLWGPDAWLGAQYGFVGLTAMMLAAAALFTRGRDPLAWFWATTGMVAFVLALGEHTPLYRLWALVPVFNQMPFASRHLLEVDWAVAVLAGLAIGAPRPALPLWRWGAAAAFVLAPLLALMSAVLLLGPRFAARTAPYLPAGVDLGGVLAWHAPALWLPLAIAAIAAGCLVAWGRSGAPGARAGLVLLVLGELSGYGAYMGRYHDAPRVPPDYGSAPRFPLPAEAGRELGLPRVSYPYFEGLGYLEALRYPCLSEMAGVRTINGYDAFIPARYGRYLGMGSLGLLGAPQVWTPGHHVLDMLGLSTLRLDATVAARPEWRERLQQPRFAHRGAQAGVLVLENRTALPRAWRAPEVETVDEATLEARLTRDPAYRPLEATLLETTLAPRPWSTGSARLITVSLNRMRLETAGPGPGLVVLAEGYDPGWHASTPAGPIPVHRANGLFLGLEVPPGPQTIELVYEPVHWRAGLAASGFSGALWLLWAGWAWRRRRPTQPR